MPIYEYRCPHNHVFEVFQRMADDPVENCEVCGAGPVVRVLYPVAVHFKGSGFYTTDYGRGSKRAKDASEAKSAVKDGGSDSGDRKVDSDKKSEKKAAEA
jgi:putative FmdB family regulatory protein